MYGYSMNYYPCIADIFCHGDFDFSNSGTDDKKKEKGVCKGGIQRNILGFFL